MKYIVFYAGLVFGEYLNASDLEKDIRGIDGGYIHVINGINKWYGFDLAPIAIENVPKEYQMMVLLMT